MSGSEEGEGAEHPWGCSFLQFSHGGGGGGGEGALGRIRPEQCSGVGDGRVRD